MAKLLDSISRVDPALAKAQGYVAIGRYLDNGLNTSSCLDAAEVATYTAADFGIATLWERYASAAAGGENQGIADAHAALQAAQALGQPQGTCIYFAVDCNPMDLPGGLTTGVAYFRGASQVRQSGYLCGAYAGAELANEALAAGVIDRVMIPAAESWSDNAAPQEDDIEQTVQQVTIGGATYDVDLANDLEHAGLWTANGPFPGIPDKEAEVKLPVYRLGDEGPGVKALQGALLARSWGTKTGMTENGVYDEATREAVNHFQAWAKIGSTEGKWFGPQSWEALFAPAVRP